MGNSRVYLDHNASGVLLEEARQVMTGVMEMVGNPSSIHGEGRALANIIEKARSQVADLAGAERSQVVFCGSASEAITQGIVGSVNHLGVEKIFLSRGEHKSVIGAAEISGADLEYVPLDKDGVIDVGELERMLAEHRRFRSRALVCVHLVNGETGVIQPIEEIERTVAGTGYLMLVDGVQAYGKLPMKFATAGADMMAISAHKMGGAAGVGALLMKEHCNGARIIPGGGQEMGRRGGTLATMLVAGFGEAAAQAWRHFDIGKLKGLIEYFEDGLLQIDGNVQIFGRGANRIGTVSYFAFEGIGNETALISLDLEGIAVSSGSACSSGKVSASPVLEAMGVSGELARCAIRVSVGWNSTRHDMEMALAALGRLVARHRKENQMKTPQIGRS